MKRERSYIRSIDDEIMVEIAPHQFVGAEAAISLGLITRADVKSLAPLPANREVSAA